MPVRAQLSVGGEPLQRGLLEHAVLVQPVEDSGAQAEEAAVDPVLRARLLDEARDPPVGRELGDPELQARPDDGHRRERAVALVECQQRAQVHVGEPVRVCRTEDVLAGEQRRQALDPPAGLGVEPGVHAADAHPLRPGLAVTNASISSCR